MKYVIRLFLIFFCFFQEKAFSIVDFDNILPAVNVPPYLQPKIHNPVVNPVPGSPSFRCVYFSIIMGVPAPFANALVIPVVPNQMHRNIYFPEDGSQPSTFDAIKYSLANVDNTPNSLITEWYMRMFGVLQAIPAGNFISVGFELNAAPAVVPLLAGIPPPVAAGVAGVARQIIRFELFEHIVEGLDRLAQLHAANHIVAPLPQIIVAGAGVNLAGINIAAMAQANKNSIDQLINALDSNPLKNQLDAIVPTKNQRENIIKKLRFLSSQFLNVGEPIHQATNRLKRIFIDNFRTIASTSVGRVLLYRILIEIRRSAAAGNYNGILCRDVLTKHVIRHKNIRNSCRCMRIKYDDSFCFSTSTDRFTGIGTCSIIWKNVVHQLSTISKPFDTYDYISLSDAGLDIALFHEMIHWYHRLRNTARSYTEDNVAINGNNEENYQMYMYYWRDLSSNVNKKQISSLAWQGTLDNHIDLEEVRTILGIKNTANLYYNSNNFLENYLEGDDLAENLYRACIGQFLRFAHVSSTFYEDKKVIEQVIDSCSSNIKEYKHKLGRYRMLGIPVDFCYGRPFNSQGLGRSRRKSW